VPTARAMRERVALRTMDCLLVRRVAEATREFEGWPHRAGADDAKAPMETV
jgi:hypothetical protein